MALNVCAALRGKWFFCIIITSRAPLRENEERHGISWGALNQEFLKPGGAVFDRSSASTDAVMELLNCSHPAK